MDAARRAMEACRSAGTAGRAVSTGLSSVTPEELAELARIPGNEGVRAPAAAVRARTAVRPSPVRPMRVCVRLSPVAGVPMLAGETLAVFVDTHDPEMAESVAEAVLAARGLSGEVIG